MTTKPTPSPRIARRRDTLRAPWAFPYGTLKGRLPVGAPYVSARERPLDGLLTMDEAAARLRCSVKTLNGYVASGAVHYVAIGHGTQAPAQDVHHLPISMEFIANQTKKDSPRCQSVRDSRSPYWQLRLPVRRSSLFRLDEVTARREAEAVERAEREKAKRHSHKRGRPHVAAAR